MTKATKIRLLSSGLVTWYDLHHRLSLAEIENLLDLLEFLEQYRR